MKIPNIIKIGSHIVKIEFQEDYFDKDGGKGRWDDKKGIIYIEKNMPKDRELTVFIHECLEVINDVYQLELGGQYEHWKLRVLNEEITNLIKQIILKQEVKKE